MTVKPADSAMDGIRMFALDDRAYMATWLRGIHFGDLK